MNNTTSAGDGDIAKKTLEELVAHTNFVFVLVALASAVLWTVLVTLYMPRLFGYLAARVINRYMRTPGRVWEFEMSKSVIFCALCCTLPDSTKKKQNTGSLAISILSGKVMFGGLHLMTEDYRIYINDGYVIFKWWWRFEPVPFEGERFCFVY